MRRCRERKKERAAKRAFERLRSHSPAGNSTLPTSCEARPVVIMSQFVRPSTVARRKSSFSTFDKDQTRRGETRQGKNKTRSDQTRQDQTSTHRKKRAMLRTCQYNLGGCVHSWNEGIGTTQGWNTYASGRVRNLVRERTAENIEA